MMRYIPTDKYTVAWFKLAECVAKGEKEKAFGVYRLLMHSLEDKAYAHQLEGDLLGAFQDERALEKYEHAAQMYVCNHRYKEAIALYEELALMNADNARSIHCLLELYSKYKKPEQYGPKIIHLLHSLFASKRISHFEQLIDMLPECEIAQHATQVCIQLCISVIRKKEIESRVEEKLVEKTSCYAIKQINHNLLSQFLSELEQIDDKWHQFAQNYIIAFNTK